MLHLRGTGGEIHQILRGTWLLRKAVRHAALVD